MCGRSAASWLVVSLATAGLCAGAHQAPQGSPSPFPSYQRAADYSELTLQSVYVPMRDGVRLAVDVVMPAGLAAGTKLPAILGMTPYWRSREGTGAGNTARFYAERGYVMVRADVRGSGASFGAWRGPQSPDEVADGGDLVAWIVKQPWSDGRVGAVGVSYEGSTAQMLAVPGHPAVSALIPKFHEFDVFTDLAFPGGVFAEAIVRDWAAGQQALNARGVRRVDEDTSGDLLTQAFASRAGSLDVFAAAREIQYRDDRPAGTGLSLDDLSAFHHAPAIERSGVAIYGWGSWMDAATADACIRRFVSWRNPQRAIIGPWSHGASYDANPFHADMAPVAPSVADQLNEDLRFFDHYLKRLLPAAAAPGKTLTYYVMGEEVWRTTDTWPIPGTTMTPWYFGENHGLSPVPPADGNGADRYTIDFNATTGTRNRWHTENGGGDVVYPDRATEDRRLLTYTSAPLREDTEITGHPIVRLSVSSTTTDAAFFVYLEDVDPAGGVTYLTEGILRALHRRVSPSTPPYPMFVPYHSFTRADASPLVPGETTPIEFGLQPLSVLLPAGHRIRVAIAGADKDTFARIPAQGTPTITVARNRRVASWIDLPIVVRPHAIAAPRPSRPAAVAPAAMTLAPIESTRVSPPTTVAAIFDRYVEALGGRAALEKITSRVSTGTFQVPERGYERPLEVSAKAPDKYVIRVSGSERMIGSGFDGETGWDLDFNGVGLTTATGDQAAGYRRSADFYKELRFKDDLTDPTIKGMAQVHGKPVYVVEATPKGLRPARFYFDVATGLMVRRDTLGATPQAPPPQISYFEDYRRVDGVMVAFTVRSQLGKGVTNIHRYDTVRFNVPLDDGIFRVPR